MTTESEDEVERMGRSGQRLHVSDREPIALMASSQRHGWVSWSGKADQVGAIRAMSGRECERLQVEGADKVH